MAEDFEIAVVVDPSKAAPGIKQIERGLVRVEHEADELRRAMLDAFSLNTTGATNALNNILATLMRTEERASITDARIGQIGRDINAAGVKRLNDQLQRTEQRANSINRVLNALGVGLSGLTLGLAVREFIQMADSLANIENQIRLVTKSERELIATQQALFDISTNTRSSLEGTATIYTRLATNADQLGASNEELLQFTESLNQAIILSGASAQEAQNGLIQLSQGLASGALRGDELRSVLEQLPAVADVIAKGMGVTRGELRKLGEQGAITSEIILDAFAKARVELSDKFATTVPTVAQAFAVLRTETAEMVDAFEDATGASSLLARGILVASDNIEITAAAVGVLALGFGVLTVTAIPGATAALAGFAAAALPLAGIAASVGLITAELIELRAAANEIATAMENRVESATLTAFGSIGARIQAVKKEMATLQKTFEAGGGTNEFAAQQIKVLQQRLSDLTGETQRQIEAAKAHEVQKAKTHAITQEVLKDLEREAQLLRASSTERGVLKEIEEVTAAMKAKGVDLSLKANEALRFEIENRIRNNDTLKRQNELLQDIHGPQETYRQQVADLTALLNQGVITQDEFNRAVREFKPPELKGDPFAEQLKSLRELNEELKIKSGPNSLQNEALLIELELKRQGITLNDDQKKQLEEQLILKRELTKEAEKQTEHEAALAAVQKQRETELVSLKQQIDLHAQLVEQERQLLILRERFPELSAQIDKAQEDLVLRSLEASTALEDGFSRAFIKIKREAEDLAAVGEQVVSVFADSLAGALSDLARDGEADAKALGQAFLQQIQDIIIRLLVMQAIQAATGFLGVGPPTAVPGLNAGRQFGGTVQPGQAPFPVGENGPELFVPNQTGSIVPNAQDRPAPPTVVNLQVVNVQDPSLIPQAINSGDADDAFINMLSRNKDRVNQVVR